MLYSSFSKRSLRTRYLASVFFAMLLLSLGCGKDPLADYLEKEQKTFRKNEIQKDEKESLDYWQKRSKESRNRETACQDGRRSEKKQAENKQREQSEQISLWKKNHKDCSGQLIICNGNHSTCADDLKKEKEKCKRDLDEEKATAEKKRKKEEDLKIACESSFGSYRTTHPSKKEDCDPENPKGTVGKIVAKLRNQITDLEKNIKTLSVAKKTAEVKVKTCIADKEKKVRECSTHAKEEKDLLEKAKDAIYANLKKQLTQAIQKCEGEKASWRKRAEQCGSGVSNCGNQLKTCEKDKKQLSIEKQELEKQKQAILEKYNSEKRSIENEKNQLIAQVNSCSNDKQNFQKKYNKCLQTGITTRKSIENLNRKIALQESQCTEKEKRIKREEQINLQRCEFQKESIKKEKKSMRASFLASRKKELEQTQTILQQRLQKTSIIKEDASEKEKEKNKAEKDRITTRLEVVKKEIAKISTRPDVHPMIQHSDFWIDREEVTVRAFRQCQKPDCKQRLERSASPRCNMQEHQPIVCVAHQEAQTYCRSVGKRLCSREEWLEAANFLPGGWDASIEKASNPMYTPTDKGVLGMLNHIGEWVAYSNRGGYCAWIGRSNLDKELLEEECGNKDLEFVGFRCCKNN